VHHREQWWSDFSKMAPIMQLTYLLAILVGIATCAPPPVPALTALTRPHMPNNDEWYRPEPGFDKTAPGTILKWRKVPKGISINNKDNIKIKGAWQLLYRTHNSVGEPDATVVTLLAPNNPKADSLFVYHWFAVSRTYAICFKANIQRILLSESKFAIDTSFELIPIISDASRQLEYSLELAKTMHTHKFKPQWL
jgi:hypothetical protein